MISVVVLFKTYVNVMKNGYVPSYKNVFNIPK
eukprot:CAMPEP_0170969198 /NCGR_PEP_ID=MMETSP0735-20130129/43801_1 /TAXON_ID=186038 /ORGANISM="Fragilariopsis kerguelensis, Strain L26-C5" /LENGTH=31 /DNA_ID= /DNA_START= /DNA_END= /DNA_ORIENTATION=